MAGKKPNYRTLDGVPVHASQHFVHTLLSLILNGTTGSIQHKVWKIEFPNGQVREMHDSIFRNNFKEVA